MKKFIFFIILNVFFYGISYSKEKPLFPFTVDEQIQTFKDGETYLDVIDKKSNELKTDKYWNKPFTKLDFLLLQIKKSADKRSEELELIYSDGSGTLNQFFERIENKKKYQSFRGKYREYNVSNNVLFNEEKGKIIVSFDISDVGKSKVPLKEACTKIYEDEIVGFGLMPGPSFKELNYHKLLDQLFRGGKIENYNDELEKIANNIVYFVSITSLEKENSESDNIKMFSVTCYKLSADEEMIYRKFSYERK